MDKLPHSPLIARAIEVAEKKLGRDELCRRINATPEMLHAWRDGLASIPKRKFLQLVDVLTDLDPSWKEWDE